MRTEVFNRSKYRDGSEPGDDVPLVVPGVIHGVFDGATDPRGTRLNGMAAGRFAALVVASEMAALALDPAFRTMPGTEIIDRVSAALRGKTAPFGLPIPPSTTLAVAIDCGETWRFLLLGDSGIRLNGLEIHRSQKMIDVVSTAARVAVFNELLASGADLDQVEMKARSSIFLGLEGAISAGLFSAGRAREIVDETIDATGLGEASDIVSRFLMGGIQTQHEFGNETGTPLCFDTMNGAQPQLGELKDFERSKADVGTIEIFSDGYPSLPKEPTTMGWESAFHAAETEDFHKTGRFATVKGSTSKEFFDDRTVVILG